MKKVITALVLLTSILSTNAQSELTGEDDFGSWFMYFGTMAAGKNRASKLLPSLLKY